MSAYTIIPIKLGENTGMDKSILVMMSPGGQKIDVPIISFLIKGEGRTILVDTGPCDVEWAREHHYAFKKEPDEEIVPAIEKAGCTVDEIDCVIMTHLHWDHCFNMEHFPGKRFYLQKSEIVYALDPLPVHRKAYESPQLGMRPPWLDYLPQFNYVNGDCQLYEGIRLVHLPGHTPGSQGVLVDTAKGRHLIAGDCVQTYDNWNGNALMRHIPSGLSTNLEEYFRTLDRIEGLCDVLIPGHDPQVLLHKEYPY